LLPKVNSIPLFRYILVLATPGSTSAGRAISNFSTECAKVKKTTKIG
jgi:hypothetical protein